MLPVLGIGISSNWQRLPGAHPTQNITIKRTIPLISAPEAFETDDPNADQLILPYV